MFPPEQAVIQLIGFGRPGTLSARVLVLTLLTQLWTNSEKLLGVNPVPKALRLLATVVAVLGDSKNDFTVYDIAEQLPPRLL